MRLRALHLENVRRFAAQRLSVTGLGDGISVLAAPNEFGKSTLFDALHALFFQRHGSSAEPLRSLQPYSGGAVGVAAEIETASGAFRVEKRFLSRPSARVLRLPDGVLLAQQDEAETWIADALGAAGKGPAGLLWVQQGQLGLDPDRTRDRAELTDTRRDILSSVAGEIDAMTGGRRMDRIRRQVAGALEGLSTATGRPSGIWKAARDRVATLEIDLAAMDARVTQLSDNLAARSSAESLLQRLDDPAAETRRRDARDRARTALEQAQAHEQQLRGAEKTRDLCAERARRARAELDHFLTALDALERATRDASDTAAQTAQAAQEVSALRTLLEQAQRADTAAEAALAQARRAHDAARAHAATRQALQRADELRLRLHQVEAAQGAQARAQARLRSNPATAPWLARAEAAETGLAAAQAAVLAQAVTLRLDYDGAARAEINGTPLPGAITLPVEGCQLLVLPGIGTLTVNAPPRGDEAAAALRAARARRDAILAEAGAQTLAQGRELAVARTEDLRAGDSATQTLDLLAPDGIDALRGALAAAELAAEGAHDAPLAPMDALDQALEATQAHAAAQRAAVEQARETYNHARIDASAAAARAGAAAQTLDAAFAAAGPPETHAGRRSDLLRALATAEDALARAQVELDTLSAISPDLDTLQAEVRRSEDALAAARTQRQQTADKLTALNAEIRALAGDGAEETRDTLAEALEAARADEARLARRAAALGRLRLALDAARAAAQASYFGPVQAELAPLLAILHRDAALSFDSDRLLPEGLTRAGTQERFDALSAGTREQIAVLTRLAFARLAARQGRHMPIILDDALVYSDDVRITEMFTALTRVARDQQIIVLTCRQMAFQDLGGTRPNISITRL